MTRRTTKRSALLLLVSLLFAQVALAMSECLMTRAALTANIEQDSASSCAANLCLAHCTADLQALDHPEIPNIAPLPATALFQVAVAPTQGLRIASCLRPADSTDPPRCLLYCSFLI